jgi:hypothetical protein
MNIVYHHCRLHSMSRVNIEKSIKVQNTNLKVTPTSFAVLRLNLRRWQLLPRSICVATPLPWGVFPEIKHLDSHELRGVPVRARHLCYSDCRQPMCTADRGWLPEIVYNQSEGPHLACNIPRKSGSEPNLRKKRKAGFQLHTESIPFYFTTAQSSPPKTSPKLSLGIGTSTTSAGLPLISIRLRAHRSH